MIIREANRSDNAALLALSRRAPMDAKLVVNNDRTPDYFYLDELMGEQPVVLVAEERDTIIGTVGIVFRTVQYRSKSIPIAYIGGIKIENPSQNTLLTFRLMKYTMDYLMDTPVKFGFILVIGANRAMEALLSGRAGIPPFHLVSRYKVKNIFSLPPMYIRKRYLLRRANPEDIPLLADHYRQFYADWELGPDWNTAYLTSLFQQKDFRIDNTWLAFQDTNLVAAISLWDLSRIKNTVISHYGGEFAFLKRLFAPFRLLPDLGEPLSEIVIRHLAYQNGYSDAAVNLLKYVIRKYRQDYRFFRCGYPLHSKQELIYKKFFGLSIPVNFYTVFRTDDPDRDEMNRHLQQALVWEDLSLH
jgi:hypothetical protein